MLFLRESSLKSSNCIALVLDVYVQLVVVVEQGEILSFSLVELLDHNRDIVCSSDLLDLIQVMLTLEQHCLLVFALL